MDKDLKHIACLKKDQRKELARRAPAWLMNKLAELPCDMCGAILLVGPNAQQILHDELEYKAVCNDCAASSAAESIKTGRDVLVTQLPLSKEEKGS